MNEYLRSPWFLAAAVAMLVACGPATHRDPGGVDGGGLGGDDAGAAGGGGGMGVDDGGADAGSGDAGSGAADAGTDAGTAPVIEGDDPGECADNLDNDGDGATDCAEAACAGKLCRRVADACDSAEFCAGGVCPADPTPVTYVGAGLGAGHSCAITTAGALVCWGANAEGQLGDGSRIPRSKPRQVIGLTSGVTSVVAGSNFTCALTSAGGVKCWGANGYGQLGDGTWTDHATPADVSGLTSGVTALAAGSNHVCALTTAGGVKCWGNGYSGQLGDGSTTPSPSPVDVTGLASGVSSLSAGFDRTCAVTSAGAAKCWGGNTGGTLGIGNQPASVATPQDVTAFSTGVSSIATGSYHSCALTTAGAVKCWGMDTGGQLGDDLALADSLAPVQVAGLTTGVTAISAGTEHTCALLASGGLKCWGANPAGQIGDRSMTLSATPVDVWGQTTGLSSVASGGQHTCALSSTGLVRCWGQNNVGQLGDGTTQRRPPVDHLGLTNVTQISGGGTHACARTTAGGAQCWGYNGAGELGNGTTLMSSGPVPVTGLASGVVTVRAAATGTSPGFSCALTAVGGLKCWGSNAGGQLGDGTTTDRATPVDVTGLTSGVVSFSVGSGHACAVTTSGAVKCWGYGGTGQLGHGVTDPSPVPVDVTGLGSGALAVAAGRGHSCALLTGGNVKCWGAADQGQLGNGSSGGYGVPFPVDVTTLGGPVNDIAAAGNHTCASTTTGLVKCWGSNSCTLCGSDPYCRENCGVAVTAPASAGSTALTAGEEMDCVITPAGPVQCWGTSTSSMGTPTITVPSGTAAYVSLSAGSKHACALRADGTVLCWGDDEWALVSGTFSWGLRQVCN